MEPLTVTNDPVDVAARHTDALVCFPDAHTDADTTRRFKVTLDYLWHTCRCCVYVCVRDWRVRVFAPFCNTEFRNTWGAQLTGVGALAPPEARPPDQWWANADLVCTRPQGARGWGTGHLATYRSLVDAALREHPVRYASFFLNKRDHPLVRRDATHPYHHVWAGAVPHVPGGTQDLLPVLSPYTGRAFLDRPLPTAQDWVALGGTTPALADEQPRTDVVRVAWKSRRRVALWRGTNTNPVRAQLCAHFAAHPLFDVALTRSQGGRIVARRGHVERRRSSRITRAAKADRTASSCTARYPCHSCGPDCAYLDGM